MNASENQKTLQDIKQMMERSSRFISLSGWSGISAGLCALAGAGAAKYFLISYYAAYRLTGPTPKKLFYQLLIVAILVFISALVSAFLFTLRKTKKDGSKIWGASSKKLLWHTSLPMITGAIVILRLMLDNKYYLIAAFSLIFYALGLINGSKFTLGEVRYLGYSILLLGLLNLFLPHYSLLFWTLGFGVAHIIYGMAMWYKYDKQ